MQVKITTKRRTYDFREYDVTSIVERKSKTNEGLVWLVLKKDDTDLAKFRLTEVEAILFIDIG